LGGAIVVAALAIAAEVGLSAVQRKLTPEGLRLSQRSASRSRPLFIPKRRIAPTP
jgi:osmoprotectant transport system permease protein